MTALSDAIDAAAEETVSEYLAGGLEPDGIALSLGFRSNANLGYGTDLLCREDCTANMDEVDPESPEAVASDLFRRLSTTKGKILNDPEAIVAVGEDPHYGYALASLLNEGSTAAEVAAHADLAAAECRRDDRLKACTVELTKRGSEWDVLVTFELKVGGVYSNVFRLTKASDISDGAES